jgi:putative ABC transport system permease protein
VISMAAVRKVMWAELRRRWPSYAALGVLAGVLAAVVLACVAGARRTSTVPARLADASGAWDVMAIAFDANGDPSATDAVLDGISQTPGVVDVERFIAPVGRALGSLDWFAPLALAREDASFHPPLVSGRWPTPGAADEVVVSQATARRPAYGLGAVVPYQLYRADQLGQLGEDTTLLPAGERFDLRVVGIVRDLADLSDTPTKLAVGGSALYEAFRRAGGSPGVLLRLAPDVDRRDLMSAVYARVEDEGPLGPGTILDIAPRDLGDQARPYDTMSTGLLVVGGVAALVGIAVLVQATTRQLAGSASEPEVLGVLGMRPVERGLAQLSTLVFSAVVGGLVAVSGAVLLSPLFPLGSLRWLEPDPGVTVDAPVVAIGAVVVAAVVLGVGACVSARSMMRRSSTAPRPTRAVKAMARAGASPYQVAGAQFALEPSHERRGVPVRTAHAGAALAVAGVVGAIVVGTNLERLVTSPQRYGTPAELALEVAVAERTALVHELIGDPDVDAVGVLWSTSVAVGNREAVAYAIESRSGDLDFTVTAGRIPVSDGEVALGPNLLEELDLQIGDEVTLAVPGDGRREQFVVVGAVLAPVDRGGDFAGQVVTTIPGFERLGITEGLGGLSGDVAVRLRAGTDLDAVYDRLDRAHPAEVQDEARIPRPEPIDALARAGTLAWLFGAVVGLAGSTALVHALAVGVRRHRRDLGVLRACGATTAETGRAMRWMALTVAVVGVLLGVPAGLLGGGFVWRRIASGIDVVPDVMVPMPAVIAVMTATVALAVVAAVPSGARARRLRVVDVLRAE